MEAGGRPDGSAIGMVIADAVSGSDAGGTRAIGWFQSTSDSGLQARLLDALALEAGTSPPALETLLVIVAAEHLAMPAIRRLVADHGRAEDIEQEVLIAVARSVARFRGEAAFRTWLHRVARNVTIDAIRRSRDQVNLGTVENRLAGSIGLSSMVATSAAVRAAVDSLPESYREPIVLRDLQRLSYEEIATRLDLKLNTVRSRILRGRAQLAALLRDDSSEADRLG